ncbi:MAG: hypothetical protein GQ535_03590 [Rhodobacteraceae bacterium]|nr:hypothetical protein [Paracoccaceae bacterium]
MNRISQDVTTRRAAFLSKSAFAFFDQRGLALDRLKASVIPKFPDATAMLITSSPVQGLATETSDIDLIAIAEEGGGGMATQIYVDGHHAEVALITPLALDEVFAKLSNTSEASLQETIATMRDWDETQPVKKKYLERVINGVTFDGNVQFRHMFQPLAWGFAAQAFGRMIDALAAMKLALAAGETRAPWIYALAAIDHAMDVVLCNAGYVYQNRKWIASRWRQHGSDALDAHPGLVAARTLGDEAFLAMRALQDGQPDGLVDWIDLVVAELAEVMGCAARIGLKCKPAVECRTLGSGAIVAIGSHRSVMLLGNETLPDWISLQDAQSVGAQRYLSALRAGVMTAEVAA